MPGFFVGRGAVRQDTSSEEMSVAAWRGASLRAGLVLTCLLGPLQARAASCGIYGAVYEPRPQPALHDPDQPAFYRLTIRHQTAAAAGARWVFQLYTPNGKTLQTELAMDETCPNGKGLCQLGISGDAGTSSAIVTLHRDFSPANMQENAPYAIILPGFAAANWVFAKSDPAMMAMRFFDKSDAYPDLSQAVTWVRVACGG
ncbi:hypothetical protein MXAZACID_09701 [Acidocella sp. MX-AZ02]|nr:hypothetical protein MXAZACID_09701 [Acidocella sp. MX-AZ02]